MAYNFTDAANPVLHTTIDATGSVSLVDGEEQGDYITSAFRPTTVTVTIVPPSGWTLASVNWSAGTGTFVVPAFGREDVYSFDYTVVLGGTSQTNRGFFKIKRAGGDNSYDPIQPWPKK